MHINYYYKNIDPLQEASQTYIEERINVLNRMRVVDQTRVEVETIKNGDFHMSVQINCGSDVFYADATTQSITACIDEVQEKLQVQMRRKKKRVRDLMKRGARSIKKKLTIHDDARL